MSIRKSKRKIALCIASIFWAACENDSSTAPDVSTPPESSETNAAGVPHSSDTPTSSESASHLNYPYTLKLNTAIHCKDSTFLIPSPCSTSKPGPVSKASDLEETAPLYGIVNPSCTIPSKNLPVFTCDDGTIIPAQGNTPAFQVVADTIIQCALERNNGCPPAEEEFAKVIAETEASSVYPYKLAKDTTVNCKQGLQLRYSRLSHAAMRDTLRLVGARVRFAHHRCFCRGKAPPKTIVFSLGASC